MKDQAEPWLSQQWLSAEPPSPRQARWRGWEGLGGCCFPASLRISRLCHPDLHRPGWQAEIYITAPVKYHVPKPPGSGCAACLGRRMSNSALAARSTPGEARPYPYRHAWHHQDPWLGWGDDHVAARRRSGRITLLYRCTQPTCRGAKREGSPVKSRSSERDSSLCTSRSERMLLLLHIAVESNVACSTGASAPWLFRG